MQIYITANFQGQHNSMYNYSLLNLVVHMKSTLLAILFLILSYTLPCQGQNSVSFVRGSLQKKDPFWKHAIAPAVFTGLSVRAWQTDENVRNIRNRYLPNYYNKVDDYMQ